MKSDQNFQFENVTNFSLYMLKGSKYAEFSFLPKTPHANLFYFAFQINDRNDLPVNFILMNQHPTKTSTHLGYK